MIKFCLTTFSRTNVLAVILISGLLYGCNGQEGKQSSKPNIIVILSDDMGFCDIGNYGSEIKTPNLDELARSGIRFTQFYNTARCSPSRASILTGLYPHQAGVGFLTTANQKPVREILGAPGYTDFLSKNCVTIAEALKPAGYQTYLSGKWHVGQYRPHWPVDRGFDQSLVILSGYHYFDPGQGVFALNDTLIEPDPENFYSTNYFTDQAVEFIDQHNSDEPLFMYLAYTSPHWPIHAPEDEIAKYEGSYMVGWDSLRVQRYERMKELGIIDKDYPLSERYESIPEWNTLPQEVKEMWDRKMSVYAAQISIMDRGIGRVMDQLEEKGMMDNTLIMFLADNGGCAEHQDRGDTIAPLGSPGSWSSYGAWSTVSNTPFRLFKHYVHEGGIATPFIAHWPEGITRNSSNFVRQPSHITDIMATCLDAAGATYPTEHNGNQITPTPGKSLVPYFEGKDPVNHETIYWEHEGNRALLEGEWKIVSRLEYPWELYNLEEDRTELNDLSGDYPEKVTELTEKWQTWADEVGVVPWSLTGKVPKIPDYAKIIR
jgi:arylsulfatase A-like enzyme